MLQSRSEGKVAILFNSAVFTLLRLGCKKVAKAILKTANASRLENELTQMRNLTWGQGSASEFYEMTYCVTDLYV